MEIVSRDVLPTEESADLEPLPDTKLAKEPTKQLHSSEEFLSEQPKINIKKHDIEPTIYSFQTEEMQGNRCDQCSVEFFSSNLRPIVRVACNSLYLL